MNKLDNKTPRNANNGTSSGAQSGGVVIVTGVAKKKIQKQKGELIEQNQDGLEYSSEEEGENLHETAAGIANKQKRELAKVDHATTEYQPFRKSFYVEVPEIGILYVFLYVARAHNLINFQLCVLFMFFHPVALYLCSENDARRSGSVQRRTGGYSCEG